MSGVETNGAELAASIHGAGQQMLAGLGTEDRMAALLQGAVQMPRATGAAAGTVRATGDPPTVSLTAGSGQADYVNIIEFGSRYVPARHPLMRALDTSMPQLLALAIEGINNTLDTI